MRIVLFMCLFILSFILISEAVAILIPVSFFYTIANALHIYGVESVIVFMTLTNFVISVLSSVSLVLLFTLGKERNQ